jgi:uncharacterized phage protein (TIGR02220 family)
VGEFKKRMKEAKWGKIPTPPKETPEEAKLITQILDYFVKKTGRKITISNNLHRSKVRARLSEGHKLEDFKHVVDVKTMEWKGSLQEIYLRTETLFGNKFDTYRTQRLYTGNKIVALMPNTKK